MGSLTSDIDQAITGAVNARIEAELTKALSGDEVIGQYVAAAMRQTVEVPRRSGSYGKDRVPFLNHLLYETIRGATEAAARDLIAEELPIIKAEVRKALRRNVAALADTLVDSLGAAADKAYGVKVELSLQMPSA